MGAGVRHYTPCLQDTMVGDPVGGLSTLSRSDILRNVLGLAAAAGSFRGGAAVAHAPAVAKRQNQYLPDPSPGKCAGAAAIM